MAAIPLRHEPEIEYPESNGQPMAESDVHLDAMVGVIQGLKDHFATDPDVYVAGNLLLYYEEGKRSSVAPDAFVVAVFPSASGGPICSGARARLPVSSWRSRGQAGRVDLRFAPGRTRPPFAHLHS